MSCQSIDSPGCWEGRTAEQQAVYRATPPTAQELHDMEFRVFSADANAKAAGYKDAVDMQTQVGAAWKAAYDATGDAALAGSLITVTPDAGQAQAILDAVAKATLDATNAQQAAQAALAAQATLDAQQTAVAATQTPSSTTSTSTSISTPVLAVIGLAVIAAIYWFVLRPR